MANIIELDDYRPHLVGNAVCKKCRHKWVAVVIATCKTKLECPKCHKMAGVFLNYELRDYGK